MRMICDVPDEVIKSVRMGTWCGSSVAEKMIANGIPLEQIQAEIYEHFMTIDGGVHDESAKKCMQIIDKYR